MFLNFNLMSIKLIEDKEFDLSNSDNQDLLGTKPYAETLFEVIKKSKGKQNIGLFGGWGSGKSTIVKTLEVFIENHNTKKDSKKIAYYKYDAWKYSKDDFRRSFIKSLNSKFKVLKEEAINEILYNETTSQDTSKTKVDINYPQVTLLLVVAVILLVVIGKFVLPSIQSDDTKSILVLVSLLASFLFYISRDIFRVVPFSVKQSRLIEPERFEDTFQLIINKIFGINKNWMDKFKDFFITNLDFSKAVIVIDNLDRCDNENLKETLITMKNFLENENVIFLLPVDENGVTSFLDGNSEEAEEYLRKIFHQIIRLKKFTPKELVMYTRELNDNKKLNLSNIGIRLICQEFTTNPRKIIQFLNNLQTERDLIKRQIKEGYLDIDYNSQADDFLIKLLIIRQEWNNLYRKILDDINLLNKINKAITKDIQYIDSFYYLPIGNEELKLNRNQKRFFQRNIHVHFDYVEPFILNIDRDKEVPDELRNFIENGEIDNIYESLSIKEEKDINNQNVKLLLSQIENSYDYNITKFDDYSSIALPLLNVCLHFLSHEPIKAELKKNFKNYSFIKKIFANDKFSNIIDDLKDFKGFCVVSKWLKDEMNYKIPDKKLFSYLNGLLASKEDVEGLDLKLKHYINVYKDDKSQITGLSKNLNSKLISEPKMIGDLKLNKQNYDVSREILDYNFFYKIFGKLNKNEIKSKSIIDSIISLTNIFLEESLIDNWIAINEINIYYLNKLEKDFTLVHPTPKGVFKLKETFDKINFLLPKSEIEELPVDTELFENILDDFKIEYNDSLSEKELDSYISFLNMIMSYMHINKDYSTDENIEAYFDYFFDKSNSMYLCFAINDLYQEEINFFGFHEWNFFDSIINKLKKYRRLKFVDTLMLLKKNSNSEKGLNKEQELEIVETLIDLVIFYTSDSRKKYPNVINQLNSAFNEFLIGNEEVLRKAIASLDKVKLKSYVRNIHKMHNEDLILNSFYIQLADIDNFKTFQSFIKFVKNNHSVKAQEELLIEMCHEKYPSFDWILWSKNVIHKPVLNKIINEYIGYYKTSPINTVFLNNFLKLNKSDLYKNTVNKIFTLLDNLIKPTKGHKRKVSEIKKRFK